jgi:hypothetical protein
MATHRGLFALIVGKDRPTILRESYAAILRSPAAQTLLGLRIEEMTDKTGRSRNRKQKART